MGQLWAALSWLGSQGTGAVALALLLGTAVPDPIGRALKPWLTEAVVLLLAIAFVRMDTTALKDYGRRPLPVLAALCWTSLAVPCTIGIIGLVFGLADRWPSLFLGLLLQAVASPLMSAPALAALIGLETTLVLATMVTSTLFVPLTAPLFAHLFAEPSLLISPFILARKLALLLLGTGCVALLLRHTVGLQTIQRYRLQLDGLNILVLFVFAAALMVDVSDQLVTVPRTLFIVAGISLSVFSAILLLTIAVFLPMGKNRALTLGFMTSNRNMALMLAATGETIPEITWMYLAMSQLPIFLTPHLLKYASKSFQQNRKKCKQR